MIVKSFETHPERDDEPVYSSRHDDWPSRRGSRFGATIHLSGLSEAEARKLEAMLLSFAKDGFGASATPVKPVEAVLLPPRVRVLPEGRR